MPNLIRLNVVQSTPSSRGGFIVKLQNSTTRTEQTEFGSKTVGSQQTYYMKLDEEPTVQSADLDLDRYQVVERDFLISDEKSPSFGQTVQLKWLHLK